MSKVEFIERQHNGNRNALIVDVRRNDYHVGSLFRKSALAAWHADADLQDACMGTPAAQTLEETKERTRVMLRQA